uniref:Uncharacterized protein n=1 Tax=Timema poppense TaxID=170557 RepID=A0A7R9DEF5_TIMPO|nr:unnamed protein product [Timema poppensis]
MGIFCHHSIDTALMAQNSTTFFLPFLGYFDQSVMSQIASLLEDSDEEPQTSASLRQVSETSRVGTVEIFLSELGLGLGAHRRRMKAIKGGSMLEGERRKYVGRRKEEVCWKEKGGRMLEGERRKYVGRRKEEVCWKEKEGKNIKVGGLTSSRKQSSRSAQLLVPHSRVLSYSFSRRLSIDVW